MKKILVLANKYKPDILANSICVENVINSLSKHDIEIHILVATGNENISSYEQYNNVHIHRVFSSLEHDFDKIRKRNLKEFNFMLFKRIRNKIIKTFIWPSYCFDTYFKLKKSANEIIKNYSCSVILTCSGDFLSQIVGLKIKKNTESLKLIPYLNDPLPSDNRLYMKQISRVFNTKKLETELFIYADEIIMENNLAEKYKLKYSNDAHKILPVGIPLLIPTSVDINNKNTDKITIVFLGSIEKKNRNPKYLLELLYNCEIDYQFLIYGECDCKDLIESYEKVTNGKIRHKGTIPYEEVKGIIRNADFLVNICNEISEQIPSKLFEYMGTGLPIINISKQENDSTIDYIEKYGNGLSLIEGITTGESINRLEEFLFNNNGQRADFEKTREVFEMNDPEYTSNLILSII